MRRPILVTQSRYADDGRTPERQVMHDDTPLTVGRVTRVLSERILPSVHAESVPLTVEWHELPGEPIEPAEGLALAYAPYEVGTPWGAAWGTTWFRLTGRVPAHWVGHRVEVVADLGFEPGMTGFQCEGLVYRADGTPVKSLNPRNQWVLVADEAEAGQPVELYVEAASNPVLMDRHPFRPTQQGDIVTSSSKRLYATRRLDLAVFERDVFELALDVELLLELQAELPDGPRRMQVLQALDDPMDRLDLQHVAETAADARAALARGPARPAGRARGGRPRRPRPPRACPPPPPRPVRTTSPPPPTRTSTPPGCGRCARRSARSPAPPRR